MNNKLLLEFSAIIAEIINGAEIKRSPNGYFQWEVWKIESNIINLLSGEDYCGLSGKHKFAHNIVGWHMSTHQNIHYSALQYFKCVFEHIIENRRKLQTTPTDKLQEIIRSHCLDANKCLEENLSPVSLWQIIERAGETTDGHSNQLCYRYWVGEENRQLKARLFDVLSSANRHYSEIYRLGLYPPEHMEMINVSQARALNDLIKDAKARALQAGEENKWRQYLRAAWQEKPLRKIGEDKCPDYETFISHDIVKCILSLEWSVIQNIHYDENEDDEYYSPELMAEVTQDSPSFEEQIEKEKPLLLQKINQTLLPKRDKELLIAIVENLDISHLIQEGEDEEALFEYLTEQMYRIWYRD